MAPVTQILLIANIAVYMLQSVAEQVLLGYFALWPLHVQESGFAPWQLVTCSFLHGNLTHLVFNMLALYMFGSDIERVFGPRRFAIYSFVCVVTAAVAQLLVALLTSAPPYPTVGA